ncbi:23S rRNA (adenine-N6)-dimethyltransferase [Brevibacterium siliguriense]|uniref:23S rRNA (Adenine-N6)-dimethyltransferase n=2 Tax=Brevibacterium TaxID=1696 RepID=A0A1H1LQ27_9MICO|nr:23S ribosomal RNA methyltransferase Erm [Brevibacterium siliguriense]SDR75909.1 23S rRNA (adenine-N6)-dimethyltransferase [Brevibacterium siliguriense]
MRPDYSRNRSTRGQSHSRSAPRSQHGGRHELGQNFLRSPTTISKIASLARSTSGPIMEIGPGDGAVTAELYRLGRELTLVEIDETRLDHLEDTFPRAEIRHADILTTRLDRPVIVGNLPFHLTTPILRRLLRSGRWQQAILLTQWEVARKRAGIGGSTMMTAQWAPWFDFHLVTRVPADAFAPKPSVDGGILTIDRCPTGSIPARDRSDYQQFVRSVFTGRGRGMKGVLTKMSITDHRTLQSTMDRNDIRGDTLPKDLTPDQWTGLFTELATDYDQKNSKTANQPKNAKKGTTMRNSKGKKNLITEAAPQTPLITGEMPIVGAKPATEKLQASIPGTDPKAKSHDKGHLQAERGFMNQHQKPQQPQPRWNLPRR